jgi:hypothetical protein
MIKLASIRHIPSDILFLGVLMILSGMGDLYIIFANPEYRLPFFGMKPDGVLGWVIKLVQPPIHFGLGFGALYAKKWTYPFFMIYSIYGLLSAVVNRFLLPGPHRIRTIFMIITVLIMGYLYWRRRQFKNA